MFLADALRSVAGTARDGLHEVTSLLTLSLRKKRKREFVDITPPALPSTTPPVAVEPGTSGHAPLKTPPRADHDGLLQDGRQAKKRLKLSTPGPVRKLYRGSYDASYGGLYGSLYDGEGVAGSLTYGGEQAGGRVQSVSRTRGPRWCTGLKGRRERRREWRGVSSWEWRAGTGVRRRMDFEEGDLVGVAVAGKGIFARAESGKQREKRNGLGTETQVKEVTQGTTWRRNRSVFPVHVPSLNGTNLKKSGVGYSQMNNVNHVRDVSGDPNGLDSGQIENDKKKEREMEGQRMGLQAKGLLERARLAEANGLKILPKARRRTSPMMNGETPRTNQIASVSGTGNKVHTEEMQVETKHGGGGDHDFDGLLSIRLFREKLLQLGIDPTNFGNLEARMRERSARIHRNNRNLATIRATSSLYKKQPDRLFTRLSRASDRNAPELDMVYWEGDDAAWDESDSLAMEEKLKGITVVDEDDPLAPLTLNALKRVRRYMSPPESLREPHVEIVAQLANVPVTRDDLWTLKPNRWLNDEVINFYIELLKKREGDRKRFYFQNTFFYSKLFEYDKRKGKNVYDFTRVRRWTRKLDVFSYDKMLVPINQGNMHWSLAVVNFRDRLVEHYDSLGNEASAVVNVLMRWVIDEAKHKKGEDLDEGEWQLVRHGKTVPQQQNSDDCGVFLCKFADYISNGRQMKFTAEHINYFRGRIASEILVQRAC